MTARFHEQIMGVYFDDLDAFRILHNARYLLLFERTLGSFWEHVGMPYDPETQGDHQHLVRANTIEYLRPVRGIGRVRVRVWVDRIGRTSLTFGFRMMPVDEDLPYAVGTRTIVRVNSATRRPEPWTDDFRSRMAAFTGEPS
jgi:acyl-CoA thioester hydrolase